jgi:hypothetical protein
VRPAEAVVKSDRGRHEDHRDAFDRPAAPVPSKKKTGFGHEKAMDRKWRVGAQFPYLRGKGRR